MNCSDLAVAWHAEALGMETGERSQTAELRDIIAQATAPR
jgi:hypothetical protein